MKDPESAFNDLSGFLNISPSNQTKLILSSINKEILKNKSAYPISKVPPDELKKWTGENNFVCLTGSAQLAIILFKLANIKNSEEYQSAAINNNKYIWFFIYIKIYKKVKALFEL